MRVLTLTFGDAAQASTYFRICQYAEALRGLGIELTVTPAKDFRAWTSVADYDVVVVQKKLLPLGRVRWLRRHARRLIYDVDDAIWHPHGAPHHWLTRLRTRWRLSAIVEAADGCTVPNEVLGSHLRQFTSRVMLIPMALDGRLWPARTREAEASAPLRIGWSGSPGNLKYLEAIEPALLALRERRPDFILAVFCGARPHFRSLACEHIPFSPGQESAALRAFDLGLLPLAAGEFTDGKSPIKALQYLATGIPCVASPARGTRELLPDGRVALLAEDLAAWTAALERLAADPARRREMGRQARQHFEARHELNRIAPMLAQVLRGQTPAR